MLASASDVAGSSVWNKGGTWEEKDFSKWAEGRLKEIFPELDTPTKLIVFSGTRGVKRERGRGFASEEMRLV